MEISIKLTSEESKKFFYNALCNGMHQMKYYDLAWVIDVNQYNAARELVTGGEYGVCREDVIMKMLEMGYTISLKDLNEDGHDATIGMEDVINNVQLAPSGHLMDMINQNDDADTADAIIQSVFYKDIIFG
jgi:hypothetical protein